MMNLSLNSEDVHIYTECEFCTGLFPVDAIDLHIAVGHEVETSSTNRLVPIRRAFAVTELPGYFDDQTATTRAKQRSKKKRADVVGSSRTHQSDDDGDVVMGGFDSDVDDTDDVQQSSSVMHQPTRSEKLLHKRKRARPAPKAQLKHRQVKIEARSPSDVESDHDLCSRTPNVSSDDIVVAADTVELIEAACSSQQSQLAIGKIEPIDGIDVESNQSFATHQDQLVKTIVIDGQTLQCYGRAQFDVTVRGKLKLVYDSKVYPDRVYTFYNKCDQRNPNGPLRSYYTCLQCHAISEQMRKNEVAGAKVPRCALVTLLNDEWILSDPDRPANPHICQGVVKAEYILSQVKNEMKELCVNKVAIASRIYRKCARALKRRMKNFPQELRDDIVQIFPSYNTHRRYINGARRNARLSGALIGGGGELSASSSDSEPEVFGIRHVTAVPQAVQTQVNHTDDSLVVTPNVDITSVTRETTDTTNTGIMIPEPESESDKDSAADGDSDWTPAAERQSAPSANTRKRKRASFDKTTESAATVKVERTFHKSSASSERAAQLEKELQLHECTQFTKSYGEPIFLLSSRLEPDQAEVIHASKTEPGRFFKFSYRHTFNISAGQLKKYECTACQLRLKKTVGKSAVILLLDGKLVSDPDDFHICEGIQSVVSVVSEQILRECRQSVRMRNSYIPLVLAHGLKAMQAWSELLRFNNDQQRELEADFDRKIGFLIQSQKRKECRRQGIQLYQGWRDSDEPPPADIPESKLAVTSRAFRQGRHRNNEPKYVSADDFDGESGKFGVPKMGQSSYGTGKEQVLCYDSKLHPGRIYEYVNKAHLVQRNGLPDDPVSGLYECTSCFRHVLMHPELKGTPLAGLIVVNGVIVTDPDRPVHPHICDGVPVQLWTAKAPTRPMNTKYKYDQSFGVAVFVKSRRHNQLVRYESELHPGRWYMFGFKSQARQGTGDFYNCVQCASMKNKKINGKLTYLFPDNPVPLIQIANGLLLDDPDNPKNPHICQGFNKAELIALDLRMDMRQHAHDSGIKSSTKILDWAKNRLETRISDLTADEQEEVRKNFPTVKGARRTIIREIRAGCLHRGEEPPPYKYNPRSKPEHNETKKKKKPVVPRSYLAGDNVVVNDRNYVQGSVQPKKRRKQLLAALQSDGLR